MITTKPRMGRPPVNKRAMTPSERQQRYRDRIKREAMQLLQATSVAKIQQK